LVSLHRDYARHGLSNVLAKAALATVNYGLTLKVLKCLRLETPASWFLDLPSHYTSRFLDAAHLHALAADPDAELSPQFLHTALAKGDECYAIFEGQRLASYGWYATTATPVTPELQWRCHRSYLYMFKAYTSEAYRGHRLHAIGVTRALRDYRERGYQGVLSYVEADNLSSLKSAYRMGYRDVGTVYGVKWRGHWFLWHSKGCAEYEVRIEAAPPSPSISTFPHGKAKAALGK
jgi:hypothetical protein